MLWESTREYLTADELQKLASTHCKLPLLKRAFLFSALTGIRWSDVNKMKWSEVRDEGMDSENTTIFRIVFQQKKTDGVEYLYISKQAREFLGDRKELDNRVSKRLGHREIRTTAIYAKIIDKKMKEAANLIPKLKLNID